MVTQGELRRRLLNHVLHLGGQARQASTNLVRLEFVRGRPPGAPGQCAVQLVEQFSHVVTHVPAVPTAYAESWRSARLGISR